MKFINISELCKIKTLPLITKKVDDSEYIIGTGSNYIKTSESGVLAVELLNNGKNIYEAQLFLTKKTNLTVSIKKLIESLHESDLIESIDGKIINSPVKNNTDKKIIINILSTVKLIPH